MSHFQDINVQDLMSAAGDATWTAEQKEEMNMRIARARLQYRKTQMKAQRGGQGRYELRKRRLEMKNNHVAQSTAGVKPNNRLDPTDVSDVKRELLKQAPSKSKRKRMKKAQKAAAKKRAAEREAALERGETLQVPVNDQESISLRLEKDELVIGGVADTVSPSDQLTE